jgi:hypothetical protein
LTGVAVKVMASPAQIVVVDPMMETEGVMVDETVMVTVFELAVVGDAHDSLEVIVHVT